jgi:hypothetical protein
VAHRLIRTADVQAVFDRRYAVYRKKMERCNPLADDTWNRHDAMRLVCEALEIFADEAGLTVPEEDRVL